MGHMTMTWATLAIGALLASMVTGCGGDDDTAAAPEAPSPLEVVTKKAGTYEGSWELFGRRATGMTYSAMKWTDVAIADKPVAEKTRAYVTVNDSMTMADMSKIEQSWIEGVLIEADGSVGPQFIDMAGVVTELHEVSPGHLPDETELH